MLAGFSGSEKKYYLPRSKVEPPTTLLKLTPVGRWVYDALAAVRKAHISSEYTVVELNNFFYNILLQFQFSTLNAPNIVKLEYLPD
jgi:hypothetical protein